MVASSSRWNPYWLLVALCSATRERADRMRAPVSVAIILLQTAASCINSLFASKARQCYIVHCVEHQRNHRDARITRSPGVKAMPIQRPDGIDSRVRSVSQPISPPTSYKLAGNPVLGRPAPGRGARTSRHDFELWTKLNSPKSQQTVFPPTLTEYIVVP